MPSGEASCRVGVDDNGLHTSQGVRLGPLVATAVIARSSTYHLAGPGQVCFVQDADATDPLVMLASSIEATRAGRGSLQIVDECFERARDTAS